MDEQLEKKQHPVVSVLQSNSPANKATKVTVDDSMARIVVYEKESLTNDEIFKLLNVRNCIKIDVNKYYERSAEGVDHHQYTIYNILI